MPINSKTRRIIYKRDKGVCGICRQPVGNVRFAIDHIVPRVNGGTNTLSNLRLTHVSCNAARGPFMNPAKPGHEFSTGRIAKAIEAGRLDPEHTKQPNSSPLFERYTVTEIARRLGVKESYVAMIKEGSQPLRPRFRRMCAVQFRRPESELFNEGKEMTP